MSIKFEGLDEVLDSMYKLKDEASINQALGKACALVERSAKQKAPKDTGELRRSITSEVKDLQGVVFTPLEYAPWTEFGTGLYATGEGGGRKDVPWVYVEGSGGGKSKSTKSYTLEEAKRTVKYLREQGLKAYYTYGQHPHPFMRPALAENRQEIVKILKEGMING